MYLHYKQTKIQQRGNLSVFCIFLRTVFWVCATINNTISKGSVLAVRPRSTKEYAVYKGESLICMGTMRECAEQMGILVQTVRFYLTPAYQRRLAGRKKARNYISIFEMKDDEDDE